MIIELENGTRLEVPDGARPEHIDEVINDYTARQKQQEVPSIKDQALRQLGLTGRYIVEGGMAIPNLVGNAANQTYNLAASKANQYLGTDLKPLSTDLGSELNKKLTSVGFPEPQDNLERAVGEASKAMSAAGSVIGPARILADGLPLAANPIQNFISAGTSSGASEIAKQNDVGPFGQALAGVGGALAPAALSTAVAPIASSGKTLAAGLTARSPDALYDTSKAMKSSAGDLYNRMRDVGAVFNNNKTASMISDIDKALMSNRFIPELNPKTTAIVQHIKDASENGNIGLNEIDQYRRLLTRVAPTEDGVSAGSVKAALDNAVNSTKASDLQSGGREAISLLNQGRKAYAQASRFDAVSDIIARSNGDANKIKQNLTRFVGDRDNLRGFTQEEISALKAAANTSIPENIFKALGKFGFDFGSSGTGNTVLPAIASIGGAYGVPGGIPLAVGGTLSRQLQKYIARGKAENALRTIEGSK